MEENMKANNRNLITVLIALIILIVVAVIYWDRQKQRNFQQAQLEIQTDFLEEWGPGAQQQAQAAFGAQTVAFSKQISYKNIVARIAPSVVSVKVGSSFINQGPAVQSQPVALDQGNVSAGAMGGYLSCPNCWTRMPCRTGGPGYTVNCPSCGMCMIRGGTPWGYPAPAQIQPPAAQNQPADQSRDRTGLGQYVWGGRMGGWGMGPGGFLVCPNCGTQVPHQRGVPAYTVNCPNCGTQMMRQGAPGYRPIPGQVQQLAAQQKDKQFQALGKGGSGVIVNSRGYVLTNHHVVHGARNIAVTLSSGQITKTYPAELIDEAPDLDFAILKIVANGNEVFTAASIGNSSQASVGDEVLAIGSPFGLQQSVTFGIVSNTRRTLTVGNRKFTNFIQTDAPINPGSSGGPLVNVNGEVIGITTAIYSPTAAFSGIGFASPIDPAKAAFPEFIDTTSNVAGTLRRNIPNWARGPALKAAAQIQRGQGLYPWCPPGGRMQQVANAPIQRGQGLYPWCPPGGRMRQMANTVTQPWLGMRICAVDKQTRAFLGLPMGYGILVMEVYDNSPCMAAGLQRGDVIFRVDRRSAKNPAMLEALLNKKRVGDKMKLTIYRDGKKMTLNVRLSAMPGGVVLQAQAVARTIPSTTDASVMTDTLPSPLEQNAAGKKFIEGHWLGLEIIPLTAELATEYQIPKGQTGVLVDEVTLEAAESGILAGDMVQSIGGFPTPDLKAFFEATQRERVQEEKRIDVGISRRDKKMTFVMTARNTNMLGFAQMEAAQPIQPGALRPHRYMGACTNCHIFMKTGGQLAIDAGDILPSPPPITKNAKLPHRYRGSCATCHTIK